jgi:hypothetical protein
MEPSSWRKSSYSGSTTGNCVEVATAIDGIAVRDTANRDGGVLMVSASAWTAFLNRL